MKNLRVPVGKFRDYIGKEIFFSAWVKNVRDLRKMQFLVLEDETGTAQAVNNKDTSSLEDIISSLKENSIVSGGGIVLRNDHVKLGGFEISLNNLNVLSRPLEPAPINEESSISSRLDYRFLDLRRPKNRFIFKIQTELEQAMREYWIENDFIEIHSPKLMASASESGAELFEVKYFDKKAYLAQSPQFYKQMAMAAGFGKVFEIGPVFRANPSHTVRHDTEFTGIDMEMSWIDSHYDIMNLEEKLICYSLDKINLKYGTQIEEVFGKKLVVPKLPFPKITMDVAKDLLKQKGYDSSGKSDLDPMGEKLLAEVIKEKYNHEFVFVVDYPWEVRPFYHMKKEEDKNLTKSFDLIWDGLEITTGAQREHRYDLLISQVKEKGIDPKGISSYLNFFKYGCPPHGGFGFGLTRALVNITNSSNVKEVTYVYRGPTRLTP